MAATQVATEVAGNTSQATPAKKARSWMITINNPTEEEVETLKADTFSYMCFQYEKGEEETLHIHAYIHYPTPRLWPKRKYPRAHIEPVKDNKACIAYCTKKDTRVEGPWEFGTKPEPGRRTDLETAARAVVDGEKTVKELAKEEPALVARCYRGLQYLETVKYEDRKEKPFIEWIWGATGVGKTKYAYQLNGTKYMKDGTRWWDGYKQQNVILIDDFDGCWPFRDLLRLLDRYPYQGQTKGGYVAVNSEAIIITCDKPPSGFWSGKELEQILRRIDNVQEIKGRVGAEVMVLTEELPD